MLLSYNQVKEVIIMHVYDISKEESDRLNILKYISIIFVVFILML